MEDRARDYAYERGKEEYVDDEGNEMQVKLLGIGDLRQREMILIKKKGREGKGIRGTRGSCRDVM